MTKSEARYHQELLARYQKLAQCNRVIQESFSLFFDEWHDSVFVTDLKGCFIYCNRAAEQLTGYRKDAVMGSHFRLLLTLDDLSTGFLFLHQTMKGCLSEHARLRIRCRDGATKVVDVLASPILFDHKIRGGLIIAQDVSGVESDHLPDRERIRVFKKFSRDLEKWDRENERLRNEVKQILAKLSHKKPAA